MEVADETKLELRLNHSPLKGGAWLLGPVGPAHAGFDGRVTSTGRDRPLVTDGLFICTLAGTDRVELRLRDDVVPQASVAAGKTGEGGGGAKFAGVLASEKMPAPGRSAGPAQPERAAEKGVPIKRIREIRYPSGQSAVGALRRGDVSLIEHVPPDLVMGLSASPDIKVGAYANPGHPFDRDRWPQPGLAQPLAAARAIVRARPQVAPGGLLDQTAGRGRECGGRRSVSEGKLRRLSGREAARGRDVAGENAGGRCAQGDEQRSDQAEFRVSVDSGGARDCSADCGRVSRCRR